MSYRLQNVDLDLGLDLLRPCATSQEVAVSIPDGVTGMFQLRNSFDRTMALVLTQPLKEISTRNNS
jgi:hypothetical protein